jgi:ATP-dependent RNA helicase SUPV3L1/SUV3
LMQRFVDRRTALLVRRLNDQEDFMASVADTGDVNVEGQFLGRIDGFRFVPDIAASQGDQRAVMSAALRVLRQDMPERLQRFASAPDSEFDIAPDLRLTWRGSAVAYLQPGSDILAPKVEVLPSDLLDGPGRETVRKRVADWLTALTAKHLAELIAGRDADIGPAARGVMFQLAERLGVMPRHQIEQQLAEIDETARKALARLGVRVGIYTLYLPTMLKPAAIRVRALLWAVSRGLQAMPALPVEGRTSIDMAGRDDREFLAAMGYLPLGRHAIRADMLERLAAAGRRAVRESRDAHDAYHRAAKAYAASKPQSAGIEVSAGDVRASSDVVTQGEGALAVHSSEAVSVAAEKSFGQGADAASVEGSVEASHEAEPEIVEVSSPVCYAPELEPLPMASSDAIGGSGSDAIGAVSPQPEPAPVSDVASSEPAQKAPEAPVPPPLPPGHFRATPEMMSYVGCSEAEMADILRDLGYRVHPPTEPEGPHSFSLAPRRPHNARPQRRDDRPQGNRPHGQRHGRGREQDKPAAAAQGAAPAGEGDQAAAQTGEQRPDRQRPDRQRHDGPHQNKPRSNDDRRNQQARGGEQNRGPRKEGPRNEGPRQEGARKEGRRDERRDGNRDGRRNDRRDDANRPERTVSTGPAVESPFAKLKDLGLFK